MERSCNRTQGGWSFACVPFNLQVLFGVISTMLVLSLSWNIFCCVSHFFPGKGICKPRKRRRQSSRQMEDNPIYGNISYMQTDTALYTGADPQDSSSLRDQHRVISDSLVGVFKFFSETEVSPAPTSGAEPKTQDCYANLTLKAPRPQTGRSSPQIQYSDVVHLEEPLESEKEDEGNADAVSTMSDLYASVQNQRSKTVDTADSGEGYANHL